MYLPVFFIVEVLHKFEAYGMYITNKPYPVDQINFVGATLMVLL